jgi:hypothetical protein
MRSVLLLPYQRPFSTALGCTVLMFLLVLLIAGSDDVLAVATATSVISIRMYLRILLFVAPGTYRRTELPDVRNYEATLRPGFANVC